MKQKNESRRRTASPDGPREIVVRDCANSMAADHLVRSYMAMRREEPLLAEAVQRLESSMKAIKQRLLKVANGTDRSLYLIRSLKSAHRTYALLRAAAVCQRQRIAIS